MVDTVSAVRGNGELVVAQVQREHCSGVGRRARTQQTPHLFLPLEDERRRGQRVCEQCSRHGDVHTNEAGRGVVALTFNNDPNLVTDR